AMPLSPIAIAQAPRGDTYRPDLRTGDGHWFIAGNVGRTDGGSATRFGTGDFNLFESREGRKTGYGLAGGYRWKVSPMWAVGVEGGYTDLGNLEISNAFSDDSVDQREDTNALRRWHAGANARVNLPPAWAVGRRGGYLRASGNNARYCSRVGDELRLESGRRDGRNSWYAGVGTGWYVTDRFSL